jgi:precorrin-2/cobalt-factor-2 C20-methyltransferase
MRKSSLYLTERLKDALAARAAATGRSEADLIRGAIAAMLDAPPGGAKPVDAPVPGRFVGVGVGPGDADLLTVGAVAALRRADLVLAPATAVDAVGRAEAVARQAHPGLRVERVPFTMAPSRAARDRSIRRAADLVAGHLDSGLEVAWVTLGDPMVYSTFPAVAAEVRARRPSTEVVQVPGIMAFQALAARTGTVIADERGELIVRTALEGEDLVAALGKPTATVVFYKGGRRLPDLAALASERPGAVAGELIGMPGERVGPLRELAERGPASYLATVIVPAAPFGPESAGPDHAPRTASRPEPTGPGGRDRAPHAGAPGGRR